MEKPAAPKVGQLYVQILINENVLRFDVKMQIAFGVNVAHSLDQLS